LLRKPVKITPGGHQDQGGRNLHHHVVLLLKTAGCPELIMGFSPSMHMPLLEEDWNDLL